MAKKVIKTIFKFLLLILIICCMAFIGYMILKALGFTNEDDLIRLRNRLGNSLTFWVIIGLLQVFQVLFLPISNQVITVPLALIFPTKELWKVWLCSFISIWLATIILYFIGKWGGKKILGWLLSDKEQANKCSNFIKKGWAFYPLGMLLPLPDDIITIIAGTSGMNAWFVIVCSMITRAIDVACSVWGIGILGRYWWGWIIIGVAIALLIVVSIIIMVKQNKKDKTTIEKDK